MRQKERLSLQPSEAQVFRAAAEIYAAYVSTGVVHEGMEQQWLEKSAGEALQLAKWVDQRIQSDGEILGGLGGGGGGRSGLSETTGPLKLEGE